jgi:hypothetical protein
MFVVGIARFLWFEAFPRILRTYGERAGFPQSEPLSTVGEHHLPMATA